MFSAELAENINIQYVSETTGMVIQKQILTI